MRAQVGLARSTLHDLTAVKSMPGGGGLTAVKSSRWAGAGGELRAVISGLSAQADRFELEDAELGSKTARDRRPA